MADCKKRGNILALSRINPLIESDVVYFLGAVSLNNAGRSIRPPPGRMCVCYFYCCKVFSTREREREREREPCTHAAGEKDSVSEFIIVDTRSPL